jgi:predicted RNA-binding Zn-ribbon protein involved in translation (DUF1610 family)
MVQQTAGAPELEQPAQLAPPRPAAEYGSICPQCGQAVLDYDGLLNLVCPLCGFSEGGGCT